MKPLPFQIIRERHEDGRYKFTLRDTRDGRPVAFLCRKSPIAPEAMRMMQARLNSDYGLTAMGVV
jgi:hypothetical protein